MDTVHFSHTSVLLYECIDALNIRDGYTYIDCTAGGGGHSLEIAKRMGKNSKLFCFDRDEYAIRAAKERLRDFSSQVVFINDNFSNIENIIKEYSINNLGGVLADLGCSSYQFDTAERGFGYMQDARLDMRMDTSAPLSAYEVVNEYSFERLKKIIFDYGEERFAPKIASAIVKRRETKAIETTFELSDIIKSVMPPASRREGPHPAKRTFQAIRIEVNSELDAIDPLIESASKNLISGGRLAIISFHSLEDRPVKEAYKRLSAGCTCPKDFPVCICGNKPIIKILTKKPILPSEEELQNNPRSRSAKLRVAEKI